jgi:hypothetical protein
MNASVTASLAVIILAACFALFFVEGFSFWSAFWAAGLGAAFILVAIVAVMAVLQVATPIRRSR